MTKNRRVAIVVHGGAGSKQDYRDGCQAAADAGMARLEAGAFAVEAAKAAIVIMEDDPRFNAGTGSVLGLDGKTVEMDAAVMDSNGYLGAVACLKRVQNPILVADAVARSPHWLLTGEGAERFARKFGFPPYRTIPQHVRQQHAKLLAVLATSKDATPGVKNRAYAAAWNYPPSVSCVEDHSCDTVGAVVLDRDGSFAVATSTGGSAPALLGRVGDTPIIGSGFYAGALGAVAITGKGEQLVRHILAFSVYQWLAEGQSMDSALQRGIDLFESTIPVGIIAVTAKA
ncbi:isoaspartyl peptidase/L-asparaginase, partial [Undibacterium sp. Di27W]|uniref:isoaspartyl peptidase/L-asparaginase n=1 Tax=Undibacterium sp. Di27W TaxID=3413036 RepID=UPI003BF0ECAF